MKSLKPLKQEAQLNRQRIMKNVNELYQKYYKFYKNDFDNDDELSEAKRNNVNISSMNCLIKQINS